VFRLTWGSKTLQAIGRAAGERGQETRTAGNPDPWKKMRALQVLFKDATMVGRNGGLVTFILNKDGLPLAASTFPAERIRKVIDRVLKQIL
jgi:hypothetical protein